MHYRRGGDVGAAERAPAVPSNAAPPHFPGRWCWAGRDRTLPAMSYAGAQPTNTVYLE
ncbi:hypothetical protein [Micromonospora sp. NPDC005174]|uniref:hypothetical protein n=1 Tax=Micromonospora sp. NPDC005174 TaxID=3157018 RepID=UPI0033AC6472